MGTDAHMYVERQVEGEWVSADSTQPNEWHEKYPEDEPKESVDHIYGDRNYDIFAILANVRHGSGFAGVDTGDGFNPIAEPRGIPEDASPLVRAEWERWQEHSPTWLSARDLMSFDWTQTTVKRGWVDAKTYASFDVMRQYGDWRMTSKLA